MATGDLCFTPPTHVCTHIRTHVTSQVPSPPAGSNLKAPPWKPSPPPQVSPFRLWPLHTLHFSVATISATPDLESRSR